MPLSFDSKLYHLISYDEKTRTATMCAEYIGPLQTDNLSFHIYSLTGNEKRINAILKDIDLYATLKKSAGEFEPEYEFIGAGTAFGIMDEKTGESKEVQMPEFDEGYGSTVYRLKKDVLSIPVQDTERNHVADITNIGWRNGWLHIQLNPENSIKWDVSFNLKKNKTEELIYSPFNFAFGSIPDQAEPNDYREYASAKEISEEQRNWFDRIENNALRMKIIYQDGKTTEVPEVSTNSIRNQKGLLFRTIYNPENFDEIAGMEVNGVVFPVEEN